MQSNKLSILAFAASVLVTGCFDGVSDDTDYELRNADGDGDIAIHLGPSTVDPACQLWDISGSTVQGGPETGPWEGLTIATTSTDGTELFDASGNLRCFIAAGNGGPEVSDALTGEPVLRLSSQHVLAGDEDVALYRFMGRKLKLPHAGPPLISATGMISQASAERKLLIATLVHGACGLPPMPSHEEPAPVPNQPN